MGGRTKRLGDAELEIMQVIWSSEEPVRSTYVQQQLKEQRDWSLPAVATALSRLVEKGFLSCEKEGRGNLYRPWCPLRTIRRWRAGASSTVSTAIPSPAWWPPCTGARPSAVRTWRSCRIFWISWRRRRNERWNCC